ncbi:MAG TPA: BrnA antitoxin family protein [Devosia sp.]|nr:BrnA antitoxin family protein [Devosia sp.]
MTKLKPLRPFTDEDEARVQREIADDPDNPEATDEQMAHPMTFAEAMKRAVGRPRSANPKRQVTVRLDADVIDKMRGSGPGWQVRMNEVLRKGFRVGKP